MKSVFISLVMFLVVLGAMLTGVFDILASPYMMLFAVICVAAALGFAYKTLGSPFADKDNKNDTHAD